MRILTGIDVPFDPFGGSTYICDDWYANLPAEHEYLFLTMPPSLKKHWWHMSNVRMLRTEKVRDPALYVQYLNDLGQEIRQIIADFKPDIIHLQHLNYGLSRAFVDAAPETPKLGICHGTDTQIATTSDFFLQNLIHICDAADMLVFPAQQMADDFFAVYGKPKTHQICPHGVPESIFAAHSIHTPGKTLKFLYAGRLNSYKGADIAIEALGLTSVSATLDIFGREDEVGFTDRLRSLIAQYDLENAVSLNPQIERSELLERFADYDAILIPSRELEAFSLTAVEAQARGLPVVYGNGGGITSVVGASGLVIEDNQPRTLAKIMEQINYDPSILSSYRKLGYKNAARYTIGTQIDSLLKISQDIIDMHTSGVEE